MRGRTVALAFVVGLSMGYAAKADTGRCFDQRHQSSSVTLMSDDGVLEYVNANHRLFASIGVNACMDAQQGLRVTASWLRYALPPSPALDKILARGEAHGFKPWRLLLALHSKVIERIHREEDAANAAHEHAADPIGDLIGRLKLNSN